jgi:hypothetical protein
MPRKSSVVNACAHNDMHVFALKSCRNERKTEIKERNAVNSAHITWRKPILRCCKSKERPCSATWSRGMQAAAASLAAHCTTLHHVAARKHNYSAAKTNVHFTRFAFVPHACSAVAVAVHAVFRVVHHAACREACSVLHARARITGDKSTHILQVWATGLRVARCAAHVHPECTQRRWRQLSIIQVLY